MNKVANNIEPHAHIFFVVARSCQIFEKISALCNEFMQHGIKESIALVLDCDFSYKIYKCYRDGVSDINISITELKSSCANTFIFYSHHDFCQNLVIYNFCRSQKICGISLFQAKHFISHYFLTNHDNGHEIRQKLIKAFIVSFASSIKIFCLGLVADLFSILGRRSSPPKCPRNVLIVKLDVLGDMVVALPYLMKIKESLPEDATVTLLVSQKGAAFISAFERFTSSKLFDKIKIWDAPWHYRPVSVLGFIELKEIIRQIIELRDCRFDRVYQCREQGIALWFALMTSFGSVVSIYSKKLPLSKKIGHLVDTKVDVSDLVEYHIVDLPRRLYAAVGDGTEVNDTYLAKIRRTTASCFWPTRPTLRVVVNIGAGMTARRWDSCKVAEVITRLSLNPNIHPVMICGREEKDFYAEVLSASSTEIDGYPGNLDLHQIMDLISHSDIVITPDTSIMHLSAAFDKRIVALFGAGNLDFCKPLSSKAIIIRHEHGCSGCRDNCFQTHTPAPCMDTISTGEVVNAVLAHVDAIIQENHEI